MALLRTLLHVGIPQFVFSSTCVTYCEPDESPIRENSPQWPRNPYGWSRLIMVRLLESYDHACAFKFVALRYFNAAGATARHGDHHEPEPHPVPNVLAECAGQKSDLAGFGRDYPTSDGTAMRDCIDVGDLADAHIRSLTYLRDGGNSDFINLSKEVGYPVLEVIETARQVTGRSIKIRLESRRPGDPVRLVADPTRATKLLNWQPVTSDLPTILRSQRQWSARRST